jgi:parallel beta-helix repeat protein
VPAKPHLRVARIAVVSFSAVLASTVVAVIALSRADAATKQLSCGATITTDTTLDSDLVDCPNNGIVIGADDITLDLNGHRIDGDGTEFADCPKNTFCDVGVLDDRYDGVKIKGGSTREFLVGVWLAGARHSRVVEISSSKNVFFGAVVGRSSRSVIRDSSFSHNIPPEGDGIGLFGSDHIKIAGNSIKDNRGPGIHVDASNGNLIKGNLFSHSSPGVLIGGDRGSDRGDRNEVRGNRFVRNGEGILVARGSRNVIARNDLSRDGTGIGLDKGRHNLVARNVVVDPRSRGISLGLDFADGTTIGGVDNIVRRNIVEGSGGDAFLINKKGTSVLRRNVAKGAGDDGFDVESRSAKLTKNRAKHNAGLGIQARRGVIDGGGNRASGNGDARQCVHVKCQ